MKSRSQKREIRPGVDRTSSARGVEVAGASIGNWRADRERQNGVDAAEADGPEEGVYC